MSKALFSFTFPASVMSVNHATVIVNGVALTIPKVGNAVNGELTFENGQVTVNVSCVFTP